MLNKEETTIRLVSLEVLINSIVEFEDKTMISMIRMMGFHKILGIKTDFFKSVFIFCQ
ncbi:hypothetical protein BWGOE8_28220 [Bacillus mycoides]|uniref:Uncharacterized protein n=1 Tax=Bacillus mycoides TaxID=1405 RepID=A0A1E8B6Q5_BACMY|nr:hypothetical protein BWGOE8_28220 [Bacillus mycoides]OFD78707.1 hypothetical protein BWGOE9_28460 [Bacillus mycoides]OFD80473.1 hypothetical protein BWGOE10_28250 [Bacillus mycoides]